MKRERRGEKERRRLGKRREREGRGSKERRKEERRRVGERIRSYEGKDLVSCPWVLCIQGL